MKKLNKKARIKLQKARAIIIIIGIIAGLYLLACGIDRAFYISTTSRGHYDTMQAWNIYNN